MRKCGLYEHSSNIQGVRSDTASFNFNVRFGRALGHFLKQLGNQYPAVDLLSIDEARVCAIMITKAIAFSEKCLGAR